MPTTLLHCSIPFPFTVWALPFLLVLYVAVRPRSNPKLFHDGSTTTLEMLEIIQFFFFEEPQNHSSLDGHENCNIVVVARSSLNILFPLPHSHPPTKP